MKTQYNATGGDIVFKTVPEYKNDPSIPQASKDIEIQFTNEKNTFDKKISNSQKPNTYSSNKKPQQEISKIPIPLQTPLYPPTQYSNVLYGKPAIMPVINVNNIGSTGPEDDHNSNRIVYESAFPTKLSNSNYETIEERIGMVSFMKAIFFKSGDGYNIDIGLQPHLNTGMIGGDNKLKNDKTNFMTHMMIGGGGASSLKSYLKYLELNPYNTYKHSNNPYAGLADDILIYRSCFPIRRLPSSEGTMCAKNSVGINVKIHKLTYGSTHPSLFGKNKSEYNVWREIKYYNHIKEKVIQMKKCPHFIILFGYYISEKCGISFNHLNFTKRRRISRWKTVRYKNEIKIKNELLNEYNKIINDKRIIISVDAINKKIKDLMYGETQNREQLVKIMTTQGIKEHSYLGKAVVMLTESSTYNFNGWAKVVFKMKDDYISQVMTNWGYHDKNEWRSYLFQVMVALYVLIKEKIAFPNFQVNDNIFIRELKDNTNVSKYWKYVIDGVSFYLPNFGFQVLLDINSKNLKELNDNIMKNDSSDESENISEIGKSLNENNTDINYGDRVISSIFGDTDEDIKIETYKMWKNAFDPALFGNTYMKDSGVPPDPDIKELISKISHTINEKKIEKSDNLEDLKECIMLHMGCFMNNRIGTPLKTNEIENVVHEGDLDFSDMKNKLLVHNVRHGEYEFVQFIKLNEDMYGQIITRDDTQNKLITKKDIPLDRLYKYRETIPIQQSMLYGDLNFTEDNLLETYYIN